MPTITHIFKTYFPDTQGGLEEAIRQIGKYSISQGFDVKVISVSRNPTKQFIDGIECKSFKFSFGSSSMPISFDLIENFSEILKETDIVHLHYPYPLGEMLTLIHKTNKPIIVTFHSEIEGRDFLLKLYQPFVREFFKKVNVIVPTNINLVKTTPILQRFMKKTNVINLWLDKYRFLNLEDVDDSFKEDIKKYNDFALFVGVLRWYKGLDVLLDAAKKTTKNILIVGKGPEKDRLQKRIIKENINNVFLLGYLEDYKVAYLFKQCTFFVLPSNTRGECFGQVLLEASFYSKPMISTELGTGTSIVNQNNITGFVVEPNNTEQLSSKMNLLFEDEKLCSYMGMNAYNNYTNNYTEEFQGEKYIQLYNKLLSIETSH